LGVFIFWLSRGEVVVITCLAAYLRFTNCEHGHPTVRGSQ
jgi:hypothetical protein